MHTATAIADYYEIPLAPIPRRHILGGLVQWLAENAGIRGAKSRRRDFDGYMLDTIADVPAWIAAKL